LREHVFSAAALSWCQLQVMRAPLACWRGCYALAQWFLFTPLIGALSDRFARNRCITPAWTGSVLAWPFASPCRSDWPAGSLGRCRCCHARLIDRG